MTTRTIKLDDWERNKVKDRALKHWHDQRSKYPSTQEWENYWKVNKRQFLYNARLFKRMLNASNFTRYLTDHECNPWTLWNIQTING